MSAAMTSALPGGKAGLVMSAVTSAVRPAVIYSPLAVPLLLLAALSVPAEQTSRSGVDGPGAPAAARPPACAAAPSAHRVYIAAPWANTCECIDPLMVPQANGSPCLTKPVCTRLRQPCSKQCAAHPSCNLTVPANQKCTTFDNVFEMERMIPPNIPENSDGGWFALGDHANETVPYFIAATASQPGTPHAAVARPRSEHWRRSG